MNIVELIRKKRDNCPLNQQEIEFFVTSAANHSIDDSQTGAMLMAIYLNGMTDEETLWLTKAFINSGEVLSWGPDAADKHSTGGVGDKISIPLAPALAACGLKVPMISGRGLDFTGGTLDKLESIPGFKTELSIEEMKNCMEKCNFFIAEATSSLCPSDKAIYKIRDITCTVECVPLIVASILGKKFVEGAKYLVLDLKVGPAAFYKKLEDAEILASKMIRIAELLGMKLKIVFTKMESPIGVTVGSSLEIAESLVILKGGGPSSTKELVKRLGGELLFLTGKARSYLHGKRQIQTVLDNGTALQYFEKCLVCQGVDPAVAKKLINDDPWDVLGRSDQYMSFKALSSGTVQTIDGMTIAKVCRDLGGGRTKPSDKIDHTVGAMLSVCVGFEIEERQEWLRVYYKSPICEEDIKKLMSSILIADGFIQEELIIKVIPE